MTRSSTSEAGNQVQPGMPGIRGNSKGQSIGGASERSGDTDSPPGGVVPSADVTTHMASSRNPNAVLGRLTL